MKINLTKKQYRELVKVLEIARFVLSPMSEVDDEGEKEAKEARDLQKYFLQYAKDFGSEDLADDSDSGNLCSSDDLTEDILENVILAYNETATIEHLTNMFSMRKLKEKYSQEEFAKMLEEQETQLIDQLLELKGEYFNEFGEHGFNRLFLEEDGKKVGMM